MLKNLPLEEYVEFLVVPLFLWSYLLASFLLYRSWEREMLVEKFLRNAVQPTRASRGWAFSFDGVIDGIIPVEFHFHSTSPRYYPRQIFTKYKRYLLA